LRDCYHLRTVAERKDGAPVWNAQTAAAQLVLPSKAALQRALQEFTLFYNHARPHQNLAGLTPAEKWNGWSKTDLAQTPAKRAVLVQALDGLIVGYCMRR
jgi:hypothetical protein